MNTIKNFSKACTGGGASALMEVGEETEQLLAEFHELCSRCDETASKEHAREEATWKCSDGCSTCMSNGWTWAACQRDKGHAGTHRCGHGHTW